MRFVHSVLFWFWFCSIFLVRAHRACKIMFANIHILTRTTSSSPKNTICSCILILFYTRNLFSFVWCCCRFVICLLSLHISCCFNIYAYVFVFVYGAHFKQIAYMRRMEKNQNSNQIQVIWENCWFQYRTERNPILIFIDSFFTVPKSIM